MAHLLFIRDSRSFVSGKDLVLGTHELIEKEMDIRQYPVKSLREGTITPTTSEIKFIHARIKKERLGDLAKDLNGVVFNPAPNNITLYQIFKKEKSMRSVGKIFLIIQWLFKWINKKKTTASILIVLSLVFLSPFLFILALIVLINPVKPVPVTDKQTLPFSKLWHYHYIFGYLEDPTEKLQGGITQDDVL